MQKLFVMIGSGLGVTIVSILAIAGAVVVMQMVTGTARRLTEWMRHLYWPLVIAVLAIIVTQIACTWWLADGIACKP